ncbi:MAG: ATP-binding cassette domain-containing protein [Candidatus ainarchaeum sp.]|nr:ATP-binding cassette domain-containing protein [Candidatus ainarchaeum sp.]
MGDQVVVASALSKSFGDTRVLKDVSFDVRKGEILGLLGPNGAGKTTTIRILMGIFGQDSGDVRIFGEMFSEATKKRVGYLPEERGLYREARVLETLVYLASLKGMPEGEAAAEGGRMLAGLGLAGYEKAKLSALSKGMQQKVQFIATVLHGPELVVLDEPFAGLDPVNTNLVKNLILGLKQGGTAIILSTHMMEQAERMCDRVMMINKGARVLYGSVPEVKARYGKGSVRVEYSGKLPRKVAGVSAIDDFGAYAEMKLDKGARPGDVLRALVKPGIEISRFEASEPSLNDIFLEAVGPGSGSGA